MAKNYKAMLKRELARIVDQRAEDLGFAVAGGWLTFAQAVDAYVGLRIITFESHLELTDQGMEAAKEIKAAVERAESGEPPRHDPKRSGIAPERPRKDWGEKMVERAKRSRSH